MRRRALLRRFNLSPDKSRDVGSRWLAIEEMLEVDVATADLLERVDDAVGILMFDHHGRVSRAWGSRVGTAQVALKRLRAISEIDAADPRLLDLRDKLDDVRAHLGERFAREHPSEPSPHVTSSHGARRARGAP